MEPRLANLQSVWPVPGWSTLPRRRKVGLQLMDFKRVLALEALSDPAFGPICYF